MPAFVPFSCYWRVMSNFIFNLSTVLHKLMDQPDLSKIEPLFYPNEVHFQAFDREMQREYETTTRMGRLNKKLRGISMGLFMDACFWVNFIGMAASALFFWNHELYPYWQSMHRLNPPQLLEQLQVEAYPNSVEREAIFKVEPKDDSRSLELGFMVKHVPLSEDLPQNPHNSYYKYSNLWEEYQQREAERLRQKHLHQQQQEKLRNIDQRLQQLINRRD